MATVEALSPDYGKALVAAEVGGPRDTVEALSPDHGEALVAAEV